ncbi:MAG: undecaprenyl-diphosphate phosphatase [Candidatus Fonsibacter sp.]|nr:undecaprenyl-diphosphate phosphatase [Pelagibacterales bacterium]
MEDLLKIFILGIIQGITEFLPISSHSHLIIFERFLNFNNNNEVINLAFHLGSLLSVLVFFSKELLALVQNRNIIINLIIGTIPVVIIGFIFHYFGLIKILSNPLIIGSTTILFAFLLFFADKKDQNNTIELNLNMKDSLIIGLYQTIALIPGVSRSGITITAARFLNYTRYDAAKFSFLLSIPTTGAACFLGVLDIIKIGSAELTLNAFVAFLSSFIFALITLKLFMGFLQKFSFNVFVYYRVIFGIFIFIYFI